MRLLPLASALLLLCLAPAVAAQSGTYPTIESAPPVALPDTFPGAPRGPQTRAEAYAAEHGVSLAEAERRERVYRSLAPEIERLHGRLRSEQASNFVELWIEHQGEMRVVVAFRESAEATLRRYTANPLFEARQIGRSPEELDAAVDDVLGQLDRLGIRFSRLGRDARRNEASIHLSIEQPRIDALVASGRLRVPDSVRLHGPPPLAIQTAVAPEAERFVRIFPQARHRTGVETRELNIGTIILRDGCLRLDGPGRDDPLALFGAEAGLKLDQAGLLTLQDRSRPEWIAHVGERMVLGGGAGGAVTDPEALAPIRAACGPGPVVQVGNPRSYLQFRLQTEAPTIEGRIRRGEIGRAEAYRDARARWAADDAEYERARTRRNRTHDRD